jgi:hypothetical protein
LFGLAFAVEAAHADGLGEVRVADAPVGGYRLTVATSPSPLEAGNALVTVLVQDERRFPVLDVAVSVRAAPVDEPLGQAVAARTGVVANRLLYAATLPLDRPGRWRLLVRVEGSAGSGELPIELEVRPAGPLRVVGPALLVALPSLVVVGGFLARRARQHRAADRSSVRFYHR